MTTTLDAQLAQVTTLARARRDAIPSMSTYARGDVCGLLLSYLAGRLDGFPDDMWAAAVAYVEACTSVAANAMLDAQMIGACAAEGRAS